MRYLLVAAVLVACSGGSEAPAVADVNALHERITDAGFDCTGFDITEPDTNALETGQCEIEGVMVSMSVYRDNGAIDGVFRVVDQLGGCDGALAVVGNKWAIYVQSDTLAGELADALDADTRTC